MARRVTPSEFVELYIGIFGSVNLSDVPSEDLKFVSETKEILIPSGIKAFRKENRRFDLLAAASSQNVTKLLADNTLEQPVTTFVHDVDEEYKRYIPILDPMFFPTGDTSTVVEKIITSGDFFPIYIYGPSGIGKTSSIMHFCCLNNRPFFRAQITRETVDDDLIGSMKLVNGDMIWQDGPVMMAYRSGGILLLDEIDLNNTLMILQPILEGKPFLIKQTGELVHKGEGFNVFATGNTKGDGTDTKHIGTTVLNAAFKERFALLMSQDIPSISVEKKIVSKLMKEINFEVDKEILASFFKWLDISRNSYISDSISEFIATRRVSHIIRAWKIFGNIRVAVKHSLTIYDENTQEAFMMLFDSIFAVKE